MSGVMQMVLGQYYSTGPAPGSQSYTTAGTYSFVVPAGVTAVSIVAVGAGGLNNANYGGGLGYKNNYSVTPGNSYTVVVGSGSSGTGSYFCSPSLVKGGGGSGCGYPNGTFVGDGGGAGGYAGTSGGGAGGYSGSGGAGRCGYGGSLYGNAGSGGGGGGGGVWTCSSCICSQFGGAGGGVGLFGQGCSGSGGGYSGSNISNGTGYGGAGGSSGSSGGCTYSRTNGNGGLYGGGGSRNFVYGGFGQAGRGAVRIIWPGNTRQFPSTCVGSP